MLETGIVVGNIEASSYNKAISALIKFLGGRPMLWKLEADHDQNVDNSRNRRLVEGPRLEGTP